MTADNDMLITRDQANEWAGGSPLTDAEYERLRLAIPHSSIPDAVETIVNESIR